MMTATITTYCLSCDRPASAFCVAYHDTRTYEQPRPKQATTEFDKVFDQMEAPEYPATCDNCGEVGTNASMEQHECDEHDAPAAPERGEWASVPYSASEVEVIGSKELHICFLPNTPRGKQIANQIATEHNQHSTLIPQRERLLRLLRPVTSPTACYCAVMGSEKCWHCEARELITAIEQDQIASRTTTGREG